jgi:hypothetical protein
VAGVNDAAVGRRGAHDGGLHEERVLEIGERRAIGGFVARIVGIHEDVGAGLQLGIDAARRLVGVAARAGACDGRGLEADRLQRAQRSLYLLDCSGDLRAALGRLAHVLRRPVIGLQAGKAQIGATCHALGDTGRRLPWRGATTTAADVDLHKNVEGCACLSRGGCKLVDVVPIVHAQADLGTSSQFR